MATNAVIGSLRVNLGLDTAQFQDGLRGVQKSLGRIGKRLQRTGQDLSLRVTAPLAAIGGLSLKAFSDFEKGLIGVGKTTGIAGEQLAALGEGVQDIAREVPIATTDLLGIAQAAGQLGVQGQADILRFTETVGKIGLASDLAGAEAATALARILTVTGTSISDVDRLASTIVQLGNNFAATESEIAEAATRVAQATAQFAVPANEVAGIGAALVSVGVRAEAGGTVIGRAFQSINEAVRKGGEKMESFVEITGRSAEELKTLFQEDPTEAFRVFVEGLGRINTEGGDVAAALEEMDLSGVRVIQVLGTLATRSDVLSDALNQAGVEWEKNIALNEEARVATQSFAAQTQLARNSLDEAATAMGRAFAPAANKLLEVFTGIAQAVADMNPKVLEFIGIVGGIAAIVGPALIGLGLLAIAVGAVGLPVAGVIAGISLLTAAILTFWDDIEPIVAFIGEGFAHLWQGIINDLERVERAFRRVGEVVRETLDQMGVDVEAALGEKGLFRSIGRFGKWSEAVKAIFTQLKDDVVGNSIVPDMIDAIIDEFERLPVGIGRPVETAMNGVSTSFQNGAQSINSALGNTARNAVSSVTDALRQGETGWRTYAQIALDALDSIVDKLMNQVLNALFQVNNAAGGGGGGILGGLLGGIFGGGGGGGAFGAGNAPFGTLGFAHGGSFNVGGTAGIDRNLVAFRASRGENVTIDPPGGRRGGDGNVYNIDARGADMAAVQRLERSLMDLAGPGRVERRAVAAVSTAQHRGQRLGPRG